DRFSPAIALRSPAAPPRTARWRHELAAGSVMPAVALSVLSAPYVGRVMLLDRLAERAALGGLLDRVRAGHSGVLVLRGDPGVGKTALLDDMAGSAAGLRVARVAGVESEMELAFAALQQLCAPMLDRLERLPGPQRDALGVAFGLQAGAAPDRYLVGLAALSLLSETAEHQPLLCVIDDAQWLDQASAQAVGFVARRLLAEPVAFVIATREPGKEFSGLPELLIGGLHDGDARALLNSVIRGPLDERVRDRIVAETRGNPLALLELPRGLTPAELAPGFGLREAPEISVWIEDSFRRRFEALPAATQRLVLVAAAELTGERALVWRAAAGVGVGGGGGAAAGGGGVVWIRGRGPVRPPLGAAGGDWGPAPAAAPAERRTVHQALANATDPQADPDRRAWHRAEATLGPDEEVAAELERSAGRAQARGGFAAAAAFLERSARLTLDPARRAERALAAAHAQDEGGAVDAALALLGSTAAGPLGGVARARADPRRGQVAVAPRRGSDAPPLLLKAARQFEPLDPRLARDTYLDALAAATFAGRLAFGGAIPAVAEAARAAPLTPEPARPHDLLLDGLAVLISQGPAAGAPVLRAARRALPAPDHPPAEGRPRPSPGP